ncbi:MAG: EAL domain-containing protein [Bradyrhizobium sp.]|uniref:bifunctional diguanylate cyclase/phosphodiesterase n=1 Tax=Bradyrhizobium sp. TaxID=376 RepID=UPI001DBEBA35|nr:EAL domain-containing protein [Bradyrhizobium sp.]MBV9564662.1 EAL domain-containing protein [Bradyrhizobium sp.]
MYRVLTCLRTEHDWRLVALAVVVCLLASAVAVNLFDRARASEGPARTIWISLDAVVSGCGIWAVHFIAMLAYDSDHAAGYDIPITISSLIFAVSTTGIGLGVALSDARQSFAALGGAIVGLGVAAMHYTGMAALELPARIVWAPGIVIASVVFGCVFAALALMVAVGFDRASRRVSAIVLLTIAIVSHHFTAMGAVTLIPDSNLARAGMLISPTVLSFLVAAAAFIILGISLGAAIMDRRVQGALHRQKVLLDTALENMSQGLCMYDMEGQILLANQRYRTMMARDDIELKGRSLLDVLQQLRSAGRWQGDPEETFARSIAEAWVGHSDTRVIDQQGRAIRVVNQPMTDGGWVATFEDVTEWQRAQEQIFHMARHDALTNLPNRTLFRERLEQLLRLASRGDRVAVHCLDLDDFREVNDTLGHPVGDALLRQVAARLRDGIGVNDAVARLGGDEFAVIQLDREDEASAPDSLAARLIEAIGRPYELDGQKIEIGVSVGIALAPSDGDDPDELLKKAELALYRAKADGRGTYRFFEIGMDARAQARRGLLQDLRIALQRDANEFEVHYQPIRDLSSDETVMLEALVRWNHPQRGQISPVQFIPLAEDSGLIIQLGDAVLRRACMDAARWPQVDVAVNLSPVQFKNANLVESVKAALEASALPAHRLELEITESVLLQNSEATLAMLHELRALGVKISLDDFGTGYSSLSYLRKFPFDKIKIDRSFVKELPNSDDSLAIIRAVTGLARSLGIITTAEGVETEAQRELLCREGCAQAQGYLFSKPRPAAEVDGLLARARTSAVA